MTFGSSLWTGRARDPAGEPDGRNAHLEHRRLQNGAAINKRWRDDVVGGQMLQQWPDEAAA
jgi:hypothetical protein